MTEFEVAHDWESFRVLIHDQTLGYIPDTISFRTGEDSITTKDTNTATLAELAGAELLLQDEIDDLMASRTGLSELRKRASRLHPDSRMTIMEVFFGPQDGEEERS